MADATEPAYFQSLADSLKVEASGNSEVRQVLRQMSGSEDEQSLLPKSLVSRDNALPPPQKSKNYDGTWSDPGSTGPFAKPS